MTAIATCVPGVAAPEPCTPNQVQTMPDFEAFVDRLTLEWITNMGEEIVERHYEFSTTESDLAEKMRYLAQASKRLDDDSAFWEIFYCESCDQFADAFPVHVRLSW